MRCDGPSVRGWAYTIGGGGFLFHIRSGFFKQNPTLLRIPSSSDFPDENIIISVVVMGVGNGADQRVKL